MCNLYENIERFCRANHISITKLTDEIGIPRTALSELKSGRTKSLSLDKVVAIADYFDIPIDDLIGRKKRTPSAKTDEAEESIIELFKIMSVQQRVFLLPVLAVFYYANWCIIV